MFDLAMAALDDAKEKPAKSQQETMDSLSNCCMEYNYVLLYKSILDRINNVLNYYINTYLTIPIFLSVHKNQVVV